MTRRRRTNEENGVGDVMPDFPANEVADSNTSAVASSSDDVLHTNSINLSNAIHSGSSSSSHNISPPSTPSSAAFSYFQNSMRNLSQPIETSTIVTMSSPIAATPFDETLTAYAPIEAGIDSNLESIESRLARIEGKTEKVLGYLDVLFIANFSKDFLRTNMKLLKRFVSFSNLYPLSRTIRIKMVAGNMIPVQYRDARYNDGIEKAINQKINSIRANVSRYARDSYYKKETLIQCITEIKTYLEQEQPGNVLINEKYFAILLVDKIVAHIKQPLKMISAPYQAFVASPDVQWKKTQYDAIASA